MDHSTNWFAAAGKGVRALAKRGMLAAFVLLAVALTALVVAQPKSAQAAGTDTQVAVSGTTTWQYREDNQKPEDGWQTAATVSGDAWKSGKGSFGAKNGAADELGDGYKPQVLLKQYIDGKGEPNTPVFYFRTTFDVADAAAIKQVKGTVAYDDAATVYINGVRVAGFYDDSFDENGYGVSNESAPLEDTFAYTDIAKLNLKKTGNVLSVELHNVSKSSSDIYLDVKSVALSTEAPAPAKPDQPSQPEQPSGNEHIKHVILNIGADPTQRNLNWLTDVNDDAEYQNVVEYVAAPAGWKEGDAFPEGDKSAQQVEAKTAATRFSGTLYSNKATLKDLAPNTTYLYRVGDPGVPGNDKYPAVWSKTYSFKTGAGTGDFSFIAAGDPQIGTGSIPTDTQGWKQTLSLATSAFKPEFLFSMGDQINNYDGDSADGIKTLEGEYDGFFAPDQIATLTTATEVGNHDEGNSRPGNARYSDSYNLPNRSEYGQSAGAGEGGNDYWYTYNGVLFMSLNSNNTSTAEHKAFMEQAIKANPDAKWKFVSFHHAIYSTASHYDDDDIIQRRKELSPVFSELNIDVVLMGHDHHYTRTYLMDGQNPVVPQGQDVTKGEPAPAEQTAEYGQVFYLTLNSASGSKYYKLNSTLQQGKPAWAAKDDQQDRPSITDIKVTDDAITFTSYYTGTANPKPSQAAAGAIAKPEQFDTFTLHRGKTKDQKAEVTHVALNIGATTAQRNFNWLSTSTKDGELQIVEKPAAYKEGDELPAGAQTVKASTRDTEFSKAQTTNEATATDLKPSTEYLYRVGNEDGWSKVYSFKTGAGEGSFDFIAAGDPQIGTGSIPTDTEGWKQTMDLATKSFSPEFLFNMGDQINNYDGTSAEGAATLEGEYDGFFAPSQMQSLTFATEVGNHDEGNHEAGNARYGDSYDMPNRSVFGKSEGTGEEGADYWFVYNNVLFMSLNSNNTSTAEHQEFMKWAIAQNPDVKWKFVSFHHAIYSTANHYTDDDIQQRRKEFSPIFSELGIDVVLMGHDHHYTRTYLMDGQNPIIPEGADVSKGEEAPSEQTAKKGQVFYLTLNSASGSKYYKLNKELAQGKPAWAAKDDQQDRPSITNIQVSDDAITFTSYYTGTKNGKAETPGAIAKPEQFDTFTLKKEPQKKPVNVTDKQGNPVDTTKPVEVKVDAAKGTVDPKSLIDITDAEGKSLMDNVVAYSYDAKGNPIDSIDASVAGTYTVKYYLLEGAGAKAVNAAAVDGQPTVDPIAVVNLTIVPKGNQGGNGGTQQPGNNNGNNQNPGNNNGNGQNPNPEPNGQPDKKPATDNGSNAGDKNKPATEKPAATSGKKDLPQTGDTSLAYLAGIVVLAVVVIAAGIVLRRKMGNR